MPFFLVTKESFAYIASMLDSQSLSAAIGATVLTLLIVIIIKSTKRLATAIASL